MKKSPRSSNPSRVVASVPYKGTARNVKPETQEKIKVLEKVLAKEEQRSKKHRLKEVLIQRLQNKHPGSISRMIIESFVEEFVSKTADVGVNQDQLITLERDVREAIKQTKIRQRDMTMKEIDAMQYETSSKYNADQTSSKNSNSNSNNNDASNNKPKVSVDIPSGKEWVIMQGLQQIKDDEKTRKEQEIARKKKTDFKKALDDHMEIANNAKKNNNDDDKDYYNHILSDIEKWKKEESDKAAKIHAKHHKQLEIQKEQIAYKQKLLEQEKKELYDDEMKKLAAIAKEIKDEEDALEEARIANRVRNERIKLANIENERLKEEEKLRIAAEDAKLIKEMEETSLKREREREEAFANRMKEMEKYGAVFAEEGAGKKQREMEIQEEQRLLRDQLKKQNADIKREEDKARELRENTRKALLYNNSLLEEKRLAKVKQIEEDKKFAAYNKKAREDYFKEENDKVLAKKMKNQKYRLELDAFVAEQSKQDRNLQGMAPTELALNGEVMNMVSRDKSLYDKIQDRLGGKDPNAKKVNDKSKSRKPY